MSEPLVGRLLIGGERIDDDSLTRMEHVNPATGRPQGWVPVAGRLEVDEAVAAARAGTVTWRALGAAHRRDVLLRLADLLAHDAPEMTRLAIAENGTPVTFARRVAADSPVGWLRYYAGWVDKLVGEVTPGLLSPDSAFNFNLPMPYGVIAILTAFNAPMSFVGMKVAPALAAGNAVVLKAPELAPFTTDRFGQLCLEAGVPAGVVNVLHGGPETGALLVGHPGIDKISFTGSGATAARILAAAAPHLTPTSLELGGKSASLVFDDADVGAAVASTIYRGIATQAGQACLAPTRLLVARSVYDSAVAAAVDVATGLVVGDPTAARTQVGPIVSEHHRDRILDVIRRADGQDGVLAAGGRRVDGDLSNGYYIAPAVFADVRPGSPLEQEEIFGPVLSVLPFDDEDEAVDIANGTRYGLAAYVFTREVTRAHRLVRRLAAGNVAVNTISFPAPNVPFGGIGRSGHGREGGEQGIREMVVTKSVEMLLA